MLRVKQYNLFIKKSPYQQSVSHNITTFKIFCTKVTISEVSLSHNLSTPAFLHKSHHIGDQSLIQPKSLNISVQKSLYQQPVSHTTSVPDFSVQKSPYQRSVSHTTSILKHPLLAFSIWTSSLCVSFLPT